MSNAGLVVLTDKGHILRAGTLHNPLFVSADERQRIARLLQVANDIVGNVKKFNAKHVCIEQAALGGKGRKTSGQTMRHETGEVFGVVKTQLWLALGIIPCMMAPSTGRKLVVGYGKATKDQTHAALKAAGINLGEHEMDAFVAARWLFDMVKEKAS